MIEIDVRVDARAANLYLDDTQRRQVPFATALALTRTGKRVESGLQTAMAGGFDSASPYVKRSTYSTSATKTNLTSIIGLKDKKPAGGTAPAVLLKEHFGGGARGNKPMEKALMAIGNLPTGWRVVPGAGMKLDAYGNPKRAAVAELLGALRSRQQVYKGRGKRIALVGYFVIPVGSGSHLEPGIYWRSARAIRPMFMFVRSAQYRKRFDLPQIAQRVVSESFQVEFDRALAQAQATARP